MKPHFDNAFRDFKPADVNSVKATAIHQTFDAPVDSVWETAINIVSQHCVITYVSREESIVCYVDIDGILYDNRFVSFEFPFTMLIEQVGNETVVYIYPMKELYIAQPSISKHKFWKTVEDGFMQKGEQLLNQIDTGLTTKSRWPWLI
jgi:hypothetical protein